MFSSKKICAVVMKKLCNSKVCYYMVQGCKKVNSSKNGRFEYEMIGETQLEMELLEVVAFIYPYSLKTGSSIPSAARIKFFSIALLEFMCSSNFFLKETWKQHRYSLFLSNCLKPTHVAFLSSDCKDPFTAL